jgi:hypothetical protein
MHDVRCSAAWPIDDLMAGARFHTGPISSSHPAVTGLDETTHKRKSTTTPGGGTTTLSLGTDQLDPPHKTTADGFAETSTPLFPEGGSDVAFSKAITDEPTLNRVNALLAPLPPHVKQQLWKAPRSEFIPVMADIAGALMVILADRLPKQSLSLSLLDRLDALPPADRCRVLVATLADLPAGPLPPGAGPQMDTMRDRIRSAEDNLRKRVDAQVPPIVKDALAALPAPVQARLLLGHVDADMATGDYLEPGGADGAADRVRQNLLTELNLRCHLRSDNTTQPPPGVSDATYAALFTMPAAAACRILAAALTVPEGGDAGPEAVGKRLSAATREMLAGDLPASLQPGLAALPPEMQERVLTTGLTEQTCSNMTKLVQENLETLAKQVIARLPKDRQTVARQLLGLPSKPVSNADLPVRPTSNPATLCQFLAHVRVPEATSDTAPTLTATDQQQALANLAAMEGDGKRTKTAIAQLDPDSADMVKSLLTQGLISATELLAILQPDGKAAPTAAAACDRLMQGMAKLVTERLHLTAPDTFSPPIDGADVQGSRWQVHQLLGIANTVLQGLRDGMAQNWDNLHFRLEVPQMPDNAALLDRDIGSMRYGHFDQGIPGKPPTMVLSAQDDNPTASAAVQGAWKGLWAEISTGRHFLGNGNQTAQTMATMLQGYLQEQQIDWIDRQQAPIVRALALNVEQTARKGTGTERDFAARLLTTSSGLRTDAIANLWAMHQLIRQAQDSGLPADVRSQARLRLADFLGTVSRTGPEAETIRQYLGSDLKALDPARSVDDWLAGTDGHSRRQTERITVKPGDILGTMLDRAGGGHGPEAVLQFLRLNKDLKGPQALFVSVPDDHAKKLQLTGKRVNGQLTYSAADFVTTIEADRKLIRDLRSRCGVKRGPGPDPKRQLTISEAEARRIGHFANGLPCKTISAQRLWELSQLAISRSDDAVRFAKVNLIAGSNVELPSRTWAFSGNPTRQMEIDHVDSRSQLLAFVGKRMQPELLATPRINKSLVQDIQNLQTVATPLQEDGRFGAQTQKAMKRLEQESGMTNGFDPSTWYQHMLKTAMPVSSSGQNFWVALTSHEMVGHGTEESLLRNWVADIPGLQGTDEAYSQAFQFWGYGVFGFLNGNGQPPAPGEDDALMNDPRTVAAHATVGKESLADGMYTFNPGANFITPYAKSSPAEAWAESMRFFTQNPQRLLAESPAAFLFINEVTHRYTAREIMAMGATAQVFASPEAAANRIGQAIEQLAGVHHSSINPAIVRHFETSQTIQGLREVIAGGYDSSVSSVETVIGVVNAQSLQVSAPGVIGPEQRALNQLLDDPAKAAEWAAKAANLQPFGDDPKLADNATLLVQAKANLATIGLSPTDINAIPDTTLLRWLAEANDLVAMAHVRQAVTRANAPNATATDKAALETMLEGLLHAGGKKPQDVFPAGVWQKLSPQMQTRLTDVLFIGDLRGVGQPIPRGTYNLTMTRPGDLVSELGQVRLADRRKGYDRLQNQVQSTMWSIIDSSINPEQAKVAIGKLVPQIKTDLVDNPRLTAAYRQYLTELEGSLRYYGNGGKSPPPAGLPELYDATKDGIAAALEQVRLLQEQLGLTTTPAGVA